MKSLRVAQGLGDVIMNPKKNMCDYALELASQGFRVFPLYCIVKGKCNCGGIPECRPGKHPRITKFNERATTDHNRIRKWFVKQFPIANIGVVTGKRHGIWVLDVDRDTGGYESLKELEDRYGRLPPTVRVQSGGGGEHYYFAYPDDVKIANSAGDLGPGLDVRGEGGYALGPGSKHINGNSYHWLVHPKEVSIAQTPHWLLTILNELSLNKKKKTLVDKALIDTSFDTIIDGTRNYVLFNYFACYLRDKRISAEGVLNICFAVNKYSCRAPLEEPEVHGIVASAFTYKARPSRMRSISPSAYKVLEFLKQQPARKSAIRVPVSTIASSVGLTQKNTRKCIRQLEEFKYVEISEGQGEPSRYKLLTPSPQQSLPTPANFDIVLKKLVDNDRNLIIVQALSRQLYERCVSKNRTKLILRALNSYFLSDPLEEKYIIKIVDSMFSPSLKRTTLTSLSAGTTKVLKVLKKWSRKSDGSIECSIAEIASKVSLHTDSVRKSLKKLEELNRLTIERRTGKKSIFHISSNLV